MGFLYARGGKLTVKFRNAAGKWVAKATGLAVGEEKKAQALLRKIETKIAAGKDVCGPTEVPPTLRAYGDKWIKRRKTLNKNSVEADHRRLVKHVYPKIGNIPLVDLGRRHVRDVVDSLKTTKSRKGGFLASRTIHNVMGTLHCMLEDAMVDELIETNPCTLKRGELPRKVDKDPDFRRNAVFTPEELVLLTTDGRIPLDRRAAYAIMFLAGTRFGEMAALRWSAHDDALTPLGRLYVSKSYNTQRKEEKATKTERAREVPVHPALAAILAVWKKTGWVEMLGREPKLEDLIVPSRMGCNRSVNHGLKRFHEDCARLGIRDRRQHDASLRLVTVGRNAWFQIRKKPAT